MYRVYHTEAFVLRGAASGEANKTLALFTRDFGLIHAHAQGIRFEKSKLRYVLQTLSLARINLVRGKVGWRVVSASCEDALEVFGGTDTRQSIRAIAEIGAFLERLLHGEEKNYELFADVRIGIDALIHGAYPPALVRTIKLAVMVRILKRLGYWHETAEFAAFSSITDYSPLVLSPLTPLVPRVSAAIQHSLDASQL